MTSFKTAESPFKSDNTASNQCWVHADEQPGRRLIANVVGRLDNVTVTHLPSMIRIDAVGRFDLVYADVDNEAGEEEGWFNAAEFEENMSTHYGRMVHLDDRTIMFAQPRGRGRVHRLRPQARLVGHRTPGRRPRSSRAATRLVVKHPRSSTTEQAQEDPWRRN